MLAKKLAVLIAAVAVSAPAFADRGNHYGHYKHGHRFDHRPQHVVVHRPVYRPVVQHYHYRPAPRQVVVVQRPHDGAALLVGAILGAAIVHHVAMGY